MNASRRAPALFYAPLLLLWALPGVLPSPARAAASDTSATLARIRSAAMASPWAMQQLTTLTDTIGPRISGSPQLDAAIGQVAAAMRALGAQVRLQPAKVPHWVRGAEQAELTDYPGRPAGLSQRLHVTALGLSLIHI